MSRSLNSLKGFYRDYIQGLLEGLFNGILGVQTMAHMVSNRASFSQELNFKFSS